MLWQKLIGNIFFMQAANFEKIFALKKFEYSSLLKQCENYDIIEGLTNLTEPLAEGQLELEDFSSQINMHQKMSRDAIRTQKTKLRRQ